MGALTKDGLAEHAAVKLMWEQFGAMAANLEAMESEQADVDHITVCLEQLKSSGIKPADAILEACMKKAIPSYISSDDHILVAHMIARNPADEDAEVLPEGGVVASVYDLKEETRDAAMKRLITKCFAVVGNSDPNAKLEVQAEASLKLLNAFMDHEDWVDEGKSFKALVELVENIEKLDRVDAEKLWPDISKNEFLKDTIMTTRFGQLIAVKVTEYLATLKRKIAAPRKLEVIVAEIKTHKHSQKSADHIVAILKKTNKS